MSKVRPISCYETPPLDSSFVFDDDDDESISRDGLSTDELGETPPSSVASTSNSPDLNQKARVGFLRRFSTNLNKKLSKISLQPIPASPVKKINDAETTSPTREVTFHDAPSSPTKAIEIPSSPSKEKRMSSILDPPIVLRERSSKSKEKAKTAHRHSVYGGALFDSKILTSKLSRKDFKKTIAKEETKGEVGNQLVGSINIEKKSTDSEDTITGSISQSPNKRRGKGSSVAELTTIEDDATAHDHNEMANFTGTKRSLKRSPAIEELAALSKFKDPIDGSTKIENNSTESDISSVDSKKSPMESRKPSIETTSSVGSVKHSSKVSNSAQLATPKQQLTSKAEIQSESSTPKINNLFSTPVLMAETSLTETSVEEDSFVSPNNTQASSATFPAYTSRRDTLASRESLPFFQKKSEQTLKLNIYLEEKTEDGVVKEPDNLDFIAVKLRKDRLRNLNELVNVVIFKLLNKKQDINLNNMRLLIFFKNESLSPIVLKKSIQEVEPEVPAGDKSSLNNDDLLLEYIMMKKKLYIKAQI